MTTLGCVTADFTTWSSSRSFPLFRWRSSIRGSGVQLLRVFPGSCSVTRSYVDVSSPVSTQLWHESGVLSGTTCSFVAGPSESPSQISLGAGQTAELLTGRVSLRTLPFVLFLEVQQFFYLFSVIVGRLKEYPPILYTHSPTGNLKRRNHLVHPQCPSGVLSRFREIHLQSK